MKKLNTLKIDAGICKENGIIFKVTKDLGTTLNKT